MLKPSRFQIAQRFRRFLERLVIERHDLTQCLLIISISLQWRFEFRRCILAHHARITGG